MAGHVHERLMLPDYHTTAAGRPARPAAEGESCTAGHAARQDVDTATCTYSPSACDTPDRRGARCATNPATHAAAAVQPFNCESTIFCLHQHWQAVCTLLVPGAPARISLKVRGLCSRRQAMYTHAACIATACRPFTPPDSSA